MGKISPIRHDPSCSVSGDVRRTGAFMTTSTGLQPDPSAPIAVQGGAESVKRHLPRRIITWVLIVLFSILTPLTIASAWAVKTVTNTQRYVDTLQPLAKDPVVTNYVADRATTALFEQLNVQGRIADALPIGGGLIAAPLTAQLRTFTDTQIRKLLSSQWFQELWLKENTYTHAAAVAVLTGKTVPAESTARKVVLNLTPALVKAIDELDSKGVTVFNPIKARLETDQKLTLSLFDNQQVKKAQTFFNLAIDLRIWLLVLTPLIGIAAVAMAVERRRAALRAVLGAILGCLALIVGLTVARSEFISAAPADGQLFAQHLWDTLTRFLHSSIRTVLIILVLAAIGLWIAGPSTWAVALRRTVRGSGRKASELAEQARGSETTSKAIESATAALEKANAFVRRNLIAMRWVGVAIAAIFILVERTPGSLLWTLVLLGIYQIVISVPWVRHRPELGPGPDSEALDASSEDGALTPSKGSGDKT
jgi:hypothetical protein